MPNDPGKASHRGRARTGRLAILLAGVVVLLVVVIVVGPLLLSDELARARIADQITQWTGRSVDFSGEPDISFFPVPKVTLSNVIISDGDGSEEPFITVEELTGSIRLLPLLTGRIEVRSFTLERPTIALRVDEDGVSNWSLDGGTVGERVSAAFNEQGPDASPNVDEVIIGEIRIRDGTATYDEPTIGRIEFTDVDLEIAWPNTSLPARIDGNLVWRGERVGVTAQLADPVEIMAGRTSPGDFEVNGDLIRIAFDGELGRTDLNFGLNGRAEVTMESLREVIRWSGESVGDGPTLGRATISGQANWSWPLLSFSNARLTLDDNSATGAFAIGFGGERLSASGTLAVGDLNLTPYASSFQADLDEGEAWVDTPIALPVLEALDTDFRISADRLRIGEVVVEAFAASVVVSEGMMAMRLGESEFYGGTIEVTIAGEYAAPLLALDAQMSLDGVRSQPALEAIGRVSALAGVATVHLNVQGAGATWGALLNSLTGRAEASIVDGQVSGLDLNAAAEIDEVSVQTAADRGGETAFENANARLLFDDGRLIAEEIAATGARFQLSFNGSGGLTSADVAGEGTVVLRRSGGQSIVPFRLVGTWLEPRFIDPPGSAPAVGE